MPNSTTCCVTRSLRLEWYNQRVGTLDIGVFSQTSFRLKRRTPARYAVVCSGFGLVWVSPGVFNLFKHPSPNLDQRTIVSALFYWVAGDPDVEGKVRMEVTSKDVAKQRWRSRKPNGRGFRSTYKRTSLQQQQHGSPLPELSDPEENAEGSEEDLLSGSISQGADLEELLKEAESLRLQAYHRHLSLSSDVAEHHPFLDQPSDSDLLCLDVKQLSLLFEAVPLSQFCGVDPEFCDELPQLPSPTQTKPREAPPLPKPAPGIPYEPPHTTHQLQRVPPAASAPPSSVPGPSPPPSCLTRSPPQQPISHPAPATSSQHTTASHPPQPLHSLPPRQPTSTPASQPATTKDLLDDLLDSPGHMTVKPHTHAKPTQPGTKHTPSTTGSILADLDQLLGTSSGTTATSSTSNSLAPGPAAGRAGPHVLAGQRGVAGQATRLGMGQAKPVTTLPAARTHVQLGKASGGTDELDELLGL